MPKVRVQVALVNTPVTVRDSHGEMVHNLEARDFQIADNGVAQQISHFDMGGDPISLVILIETSSRIDALLPQVRKTGILFTQTVMGPSGEAAVVGFNDSVDKLQDFTTNGDLIENTIAHLGEGTSGSKLYDAMAVGVEMLTGRPQATPDKPGRRRVLMILSEATDAGSDAKLGEVLRNAQLANVTMYSVGLSTTRAELQAKPKDTRPQLTPPARFRFRRSRARRKLPPAKRTATATLTSWRRLSGRCSTFTIRSRTTPWRLPPQPRAARIFLRSRIARSKKLLTKLAASCTHSTPSATRRRESTPPATMKLK